MASSYSKVLLDGSINGRQILLNATSSASAVIVHTAISSSTDEVYLYAYNEATTSIQASFLWGGLTEPNDVVRVTIPSKSGRTMITDGKILQSGSILAYASASGFINIDGFVNRITPQPIVEPVVSLWATRVIQMGGTAPSTSSMVAMSQFYRGLINNNILSKMILVNTITPDSTFIGSLTPLIGTYDHAGYNTFHKWIPISETGNSTTSIINGISASGGTSYYSTSFIAGNSFVDTQSAGLTIYLYNNVNNNPQYDFGITDNGGLTMFATNLCQNNLTQFFIWNGTTGNFTSASFPGNGYFSANRVSNTDFRLYWANTTASHQQIGNTVILNSTNSNVFPNISTQICAVGSAIARDTGLAPFASSLCQYSFIAVHLGLTFQESQIFFNLIQTMRQAFGGGFR